LTGISQHIENRIDAGCGKGSLISLLLGVYGPALQSVGPPLSLIVGVDKDRWKLEEAGKRLEPYLASLQSKSEGGKVVQQKLQSGAQNYHQQHQEQEGQGAPQQQQQQQQQQTGGGVSGRQEFQEIETASHDMKIERQEVEDPVQGVCWLIMLLHHFVVSACVSVRHHLVVSACVSVWHHLVVCACISVWQQLQIQIHAPLC